MNLKDVLTQFQPEPVAEVPAEATEGAVEAPMMAPGMEAPQVIQPPQIEIPEITWSVVYDSEAEHLWRGVFNPEENHVTYYLVEGFTITDIKADNIIKYAMNGSLITSCKATAQLSVNPPDMIGCEFFTATEEMQEATGAVNSKHYKFDRPSRIYGTCSNPDIIKAFGIPNPQCSNQSTWAMCGSYGREEWDVQERFSVTSKNEEIGTATYEVQQRRRGWGTPDLRLMKVGEIPVLEFEYIFSDETKENFEQEFSAKLSGFISELDPESVDTLPILEEVPTEEIYTKHVALVH